MIPIPDELRHLIEKRERMDRREEERREEDIGPLGAVLSAETMEDVPDKDRRRPPNRRGAKERRSGRR